MLSSPSANHVQWGGSHSSDLVGSLNHSTSCLAWSSQKPSKSSSAALYRESSLTSACSLNSSGGGNVRPSFASTSISATADSAEPVASCVTSQSFLDRGASLRCEPHESVRPAPR